MNGFQSYVLTIAGAVLLFQALKILLPEGSLGKYVSFVLGVFLLLVLVSPLTGDFRLPDLSSWEEEPAQEIQNLEALQQQQILQHYEQQLRDDINATLPSLTENQNRLIFSFSTEEESFGVVEQLFIQGPKPSEQVLQQLAQLYQIPRERIEWRESG